MIQAHLDSKGRPVIIAGLTGGIASGKSTVSRFFSDAGAHVIDADKIAREVVKPGTPGYDAILTFFGRTILLPNGEIDRKHLGEIIFNDPDKKARLDAIVHPLVVERSAEMIADIAVQAPDAVVIMDIPLAAGGGHAKRPCRSDCCLCARKASVGAASSIEMVSTSKQPWPGSGPRCPSRKNVN
jgi:hypothetical protein